MCGKSKQDRVAGAVRVMVDTKGSCLECAKLGSETVWKEEGTEGEEIRGNAREGVKEEVEWPCWKGWRSGGNDFIFLSFTPVFWGGGGPRGWKICIGSLAG